MPERVPLEPGALDIEGCLRLNKGLSSETTWLHVGTMFMQGKNGQQQREITTLNVHESLHRPSTAMPQSEQPLHRARQRQTPAAAAAAQVIGG